ncbi:uncharacterized protein TNCV_800851 [Trichonephila clavipes]|nr:uncharacterized protein TNCV_800851 [Trichonephila clavipes]
MQDPIQAPPETILQHKRIYYFSCQHGKIQNLHMCPPGHFFHTTHCQPIDQCVGQSNGMRFSDPYDIHHYYECQNEEAVRRSCSTNTFFLHDSCRNKNDESLYCQFHTEPKILNSHTLLVCRHGQAHFETCPPGFRYFDSPKCESNACVGLPDHQLVPSPKVQQGPLSYFPGYMQCQNDRVVKVVECPQTWDPFVGDNLTHLPQVFDGHACQIPEFCTNVESDDPLVMVPVHEFTKHVRNWKFSERFDAVTGIKCKGNQRKRVALSPGQHIHPKRFKPESACNSTVSKVVVSGNPGVYFDCPTQKVELCPPQHFFDGVMCRPRVKHVFSFQGIDLFQLDSLRSDNWMEAWDYSKIPSAQPCTDPESVYLETYNACSHPDCVLYPFLTQIPLSIKLRNASQCTFRKTDRRLVKQPISYKVLYWAQREVEQVPTHEKCRPGQHLESGHFVFDQIMYATCDESQPFVFCPSSDTKGIAKVNDRRWACVPADMKGIFPPNSLVTFSAHEVKHIFPTTPPPNRIKIDNKLMDIPLAGLSPTNAFKLDTLDQSVAIEYKYRVTHPPDVVWAEDEKKVSRFGGGFLVKKEDFTKKSITLPTYDIKYTVPDFAFDRKP